MIKKMMVSVLMIVTVQVQSSDNFLNRSFAGSDNLPRCATIRPLMLNGKRVVTDRPAVVSLALAQNSSLVASASPLNSSNGMSPNSVLVSPIDSRATPLNSLPDTKVVDIRLERNDLATALFEEYRELLSSLKKDMAQPPLLARMAEFRKELLDFQAKEDAWFAAQSAQK